VAPDDESANRGAADCLAAVDATPKRRELVLLLAVSFVVFWTSTFLLHKSTDFVGHYGDNAAYLDVANAILHWDFHDLQVQHFMGYPYLIAVVSLLFRVPTGVGALGDCGCRLRGVGVAHGPAVRNNGCGILQRSRILPGFRFRIWADPSS